MGTAVGQIQKQKVVPVVRKTQSDRSNIVTVWGLTLDQQNLNRDTPDETFLTWYIPIIEDLASFEGESIPPFKTLFLWIRDLATVIDL